MDDREMSEELSAAEMAAEELERAARDAEANGRYADAARLTQWAQEERRRAIIRQARGELPMNASVPLLRAA